jgi:hypothetical protein
MLILLIEMAIQKVQDQHIGEVETELHGKNQEQQ